MATLVTTEPLALDTPGHTRNGTTALLVPMSHPVARTLEREEARFFSEAPALFDVKDADELFAFLVIAVDGFARHVVRLSAPMLTGRKDLLPFFLTDLLVSDPGLTMSEVRSYYAAQGIQVEQFISVETQFRIGEHLDPIRAADLAYLALFRIVTQRGGPGVVAHLNAMTISSFKRVGMKWHPFAGRLDLRTPTVADDGGVAFDGEYRPMCVPVHSNAALLSSMDELTPPIHWLSAGNNASTATLAAGRLGHHGSTE